MQPDLIILELEEAIMIHDSARVLGSLNPLMHAFLYVLTGSCPSSQSMPVRTCTSILVHDTDLHWCLVHVLQTQTAFTKLVCTHHLQSYRTRFILFWDSGIYLNVTLSIGQGNLYKQCVRTAKNQQYVPATFAAVTDLVQ